MAAHVLASVPRGSEENNFWLRRVPPAIADVVAMESVNSVPVD